MKDFRFLGKWGYLAEGAALAVSALFFFYLAIVSLPPVSQPTSATSHLMSYLTVGAATVPAIFVGLAWFGAGRARGSTLFKVTGILGLLTSFGGTALGVWLNLGLFPTNSNSTSTSLVLTSAGSTAQVPATQALTAFLTFLVVGLVVGIIALTYLIMEILSFFSAKSIFAVRYFRYAGWGRVLGIIAIGVIFLVVIVDAFIATFASLATPSPPSAQSIAKVFDVSYAATFLVWAVPDIIAGFAFGAIPLPDVPVNEPGGQAPEFTPSALSLLPTEI